MDKPEFEYVAMVRLKPWQTWPHGAVSTYRCDFSTGTTRGTLQVFVTCYGETDAAAIARSPAMWRNEAWAESGHVIGSKILFEYGKPDSVDAAGWFTKARPGEIDISCVAWSNEEADWLLRFLTSLVYAVMVRLSLSLTDTFQLVAPVATRIRGRKKAGVASPSYDIEIRAKDAVTPEAIQDSLRRAVESCGDKLGWERGGILSIAARRFMLAEVRTDPVDRFLDYWLVCEVLTSHIPKGKAYGKIAQSLAPHLGRPSKTDKRLVENALCLYDLYTRRGDIVHGKRDDVSGEDLAMLARIAKELMRKELGLPFVCDLANPALEKALYHYEKGAGSSEASAHDEKERSKE